MRRDNLTPFIEIRDLTVRFGEVEALRNVNLEIMEGESLGILGRSGSGKSVLLHVLRGVEPFEKISGNVIYHVAKCAKCNHVEPPSKVGEKCRCGGDKRQKEARDISQDRHHASEDLRPLR
jgi:methyl coenzyme M reductase system subunit A2